MQIQKYFDTYFVGVKHYKIFRTTQVMGSNLFVFLFENCIKSFSIKHVRDLQTHKTCLAEIFSVIKESFRVKLWRNDSPCSLKYKPGNFHEAGREVIQKLFGSAKHGGPSRHISMPYDADPFTLQ